MSLTQTYMLATVARRQLQKEAARPDHDLRLLVGHANLLDGLMLDLAHAEQEQESWFNQSVSSAANTTTTATEQSKHVQWADSHTIPEEAVEEDIYDEDDSDDDDEDDEEPIQIAPRTVRNTKVPQITTTPVFDQDSDDEDEDQEMDDDFDEELTLTRSPSHSSSFSAASLSSSPPELLQDSEDSESEDDSMMMPPSPPSTDFPLNILSQKQRQAIATTSLYQSNGATADLQDDEEEEESPSLFDQERQPISISAY